MSPFSVHSAVHHERSSSKNANTIDARKALTFTFVEAKWVSRTLDTVSARSGVVQRCLVHAGDVEPAAWQFLQLFVVDDFDALRLNTAIADHRIAGGAVVAALHGALAGDWRTLDLTP